MLNYKDCDIKDFNAAMAQKNNDVKTISDAHLYILWTKFKADARTCFRAGTSYSNGVGIDSENRAMVYEEELKRRGVYERV